MKITHPYASLTGGEWLRGNLHCHSTRSDGAREPQAVLDDYAARRYDFLMLSDHDVFSAPEDYAKWNSRGLILIGGNEVTANGPHILHVDADRRIEPIRRRQDIFDTINSTHGFAIVNHPNWGASFSHAPIENLREWQGFTGIEIFNGGVVSGAGYPYATDKWDMLLSDGRRVWGFANDDCHRGTDDVELGWNMAYASQRSVKGVVDALRSGRFYASTGVTIRNLKVEGDRITIETDNAQRIAAVTQGGKRFAVVDAGSLTVSVPANARYVRFECFGAGEKRAWSQPFFIERERALAGAANATTQAAAANPYLITWDASRLFAHATLADAQLNVPGTPVSDPAGWQRLISVAEGEAKGFMDIRERTGGGAGVVYLRTSIPATRAQRGKVFLGFDGPIKAWLNGTPIFDGPGTNPAVRDKVALFAPFAAGENVLTLALDTNGGKAWGVFARAELEA